MAGKKDLEAIVTPLLDARGAMRLQLAKLQRLAVCCCDRDRCTASATPLHVRFTATVQPRRRVRAGNTAAAAYRLLYKLS